MDKFFKILKKIKLRNIIILVIILTFNSYAWFVYATKVSMGLSAHVSSWNVEFATGSEDITTNIIIEIDRIYPGMENYEKNIDVSNKGETPAKLTYEIESLKLMDQTYIVGEESGLTSSDIENKMKTEYPFKINIIKDDTQLIAGTGSGSYKVTVEWPFESGNDSLDTIWGNRAYEYYTLHPREKSIELKVKLIATQIES